MASVVSGVQGAVEGIDQTAIDSPVFLYSLGDGGINEIWNPGKSFASRSAAVKPCRCKSSLRTAYESTLSK